MRRGFFIFLLVLCGGAPALAGSALKTLMTGDDSRGWQAVGRLNIGPDSFCTGALIAPDLVLTAAHCMYDLDSGTRIADGDVQFLADWRGGRAAAYRGVRRSFVHPGFTLGDENFADRVAFDVAILELDQPVRNTTITPFATASGFRAGTEVGVVSYAHDRADSPSLQEVCHVLGRQGGSIILSCEVDFGSSGAPVFMVRDGVPQIVSLVSAKAKLDGAPVALGASITRPLADLMAMRANGDGVMTRGTPVVRRLGSGTDTAPGAKFLRP